jgi:hypothetical protein
MALLLAKDESSFVHMIITEDLIANPKISISFR